MAMMVQKTYEGVIDVSTATHQYDYGFSAAIGSTRRPTASVLGQGLASNWLGLVKRSQVRFVQLVRWICFLEDSIAARLPLQS